MQDGLVGQSVSGRGKHCVHRSARVWSRKMYNQRSRHVHIVIYVACNLRTCAVCRLHGAKYAVCRLHGTQSADCMVTVQTKDYIVPACLFCSNIIQIYLLYSNYMHVCALER